MATAASYFFLFLEVRKSKCVSPAHANEIELALRLFVTVGMNFCSWFPIILLKLSVYSGVVMDGTFLQLSSFAFPLSPLSFS